MFNLQKQLEGEGGIRELLAIAFPMFISQAADTFMMFADRVFLARLGKEHIAAAMSGGMTCFMMFTFFLGIIGYTNALVAQYLGRKREKECGIPASQGLFLALASYPVILLLKPFGLMLMSGSGHDPMQSGLENIYYSILIWFAFLPLLRNAMASFFSGLGRTRIVMIANVAAMVVNIGANYVLIFGKFGCPALGMSGAAYGTVLGSAVGVVVLGSAYFSRENREKYRTWSNLKFDRAVMKKLLYFGTPSGTEFFLNMMAFNIFIQLMHSYGRDIAAAVTITFNWDMVAFVPMIGVNVATTSLVGRYMGARAPNTAERAAYSGLKSALCYTLTTLILFLAVPRVLVGVFTPDLPGLDYSTVIPHAVFMLRLASMYLVSDALMLVFGGALRGAGDTRWVMRTSIVCHWIMTSTSWMLVKVIGVPPATVWVVFVALVTAMGGVLYARFRGGHWKSIEVLDEEPKAPLGHDHLNTSPPTTRDTVHDWPEVID